VRLRPVHSSWEARQVSARHLRSMQQTDSMGNPSNAQIWATVTPTIERKGKTMKRLQDLVETIDLAEFAAEKNLRLFSVTSSKAQ
jgi:hypothetical protein